jgi:adenosine/AMP kinase
MQGTYTSALLLCRTCLLSNCACSAVTAGHTFIVFLDGGFPVNCLNAVKNVTEVRRLRQHNAVAWRHIHMPSSTEQQL